MYLGEDGDVSCILGGQGAWVLKMLFFKFNGDTDYLGDIIKM